MLKAAGIVLIGWCAVGLSAVGCRSEQRQVPVTGTQARDAPVEPLSPNKPDAASDDDGGTARAPVPHQFFFELAWEDWQIALASEGLAPTAVRSISQGIEKELDGKTLHGWRVIHEETRELLFEIASGSERGSRTMEAHLVCTVPIELRDGVRYDDEGKVLRRAAADQVSVVVIHGRGARPIPFRFEPGEYRFTVVR